MANIVIINGEITTLSEGLAVNSLSNTASGTHSFAGGEGSFATDYYSFAFGQGVTSSASYSVAFGIGSVASGKGSMASGGSIFLGNIRFNTASGDNSLAIGGNRNLSSGSNSAVIAGNGNTASNTNSFVAGGASNLVSNSNSVVIGGNLNRNTGASSVIISSTNALLDSNNSGIFAGSDNTIQQNSGFINYDTIIGGNGNIISQTGVNVDFNSSIISGQDNTITNVTRGVIIGGQSNTLTGDGSVILGGQNITLSETDQIYLGGIRRMGWLLSNTLTAAFTSATTTYATITGWSTTLIAGAVYKCSINSNYQSTTTTSGFKMRIQGTATCNVVGQMCAYYNLLLNPVELNITASSMTTEIAGTGVLAANTPYYNQWDLIFRCTVGGTLYFEFARNNGAGTVQLNIGSSVIIERIN